MSTYALYTYIYKWTNTKILITTHVNVLRHFYYLFIYFISFIYVALIPPWVLYHDSCIYCLRLSKKKKTKFHIFSWSDLLEIHINACHVCHAANDRRIYCWLQKKKKKKWTTYSRFLFLWSFEKILKLLFVECDCVEGCPRFCQYTYIYNNNNFSFSSMYLNGNEFYVHVLEFIVIFSFYNINTYLIGYYCSFNAVPCLVKTRYVSPIIVSAHYTYALFCIPCLWLSPNDSLANTWSLSIF